MIIRISILLLFSVSTHASSLDCDGVLGVGNFKNAMNELAQSQLRFDQMRVDGASSDAALRSMRNQIKIKKQQLSKALGAKVFDVEFEKALQEQSDVGAKNNSLRQQRRNKALLEEATFGSWSPLYVLPNYLDVGDDPDKMQVTSDGRYIVIQRFRSITVLNFETGEQIHDLTFGLNELVKMSLSPDGRFVLGVLNNETIQVWNIETGEHVQKFSLQDGGWKTRVGSEAYFTPDNRYVISISAEKKMLRVWDINTGEPYLTFSPLGHKAMNTAISISPDNRYVMINTVGELGIIGFRKHHSIIEIIDLQTKEKSSEILLEGKSLQKAQFFQDSNHIITSNVNESGIFIWALPASEQMLHFGSGLETKRFMLTPDQKKIILHTTKGLFVLDADYETFKSNKVEPLIDSHAPPSWVGISPDSQIFIYTPDHREIQMLNFTTGLKQASIHSSRIVLSTQFGAENKRVVTADDKGNLIVWKPDSRMVEVE